MKLLHWYLFEDLGYELYFLLNGFNRTQEKKSFCLPFFLPMVTKLSGLINDVRTGERAMLPPALSFVLQLHQYPNKITLFVEY